MSFDPFSISGGYYSIPNISTIDILSSDMLSWPLRAPSGYTGSNVPYGFTGTSAGIYFSTQGPTGVNIVDNNGNVCGSFNNNACRASNYNFLSDDDSGFKSEGSGQIGVINNGFTWHIFSPQQIQAYAQTNPLLPVYSFFGQSDKGIYSPSSDQVGISINGTGCHYFSPTGYYAPAGHSTKPSISFQSSPTSGFFSTIPNEIAISCNAFQMGKFDVSGLKLNSASAGFPSLSFLTDEDLGIYRSGVNQLGIACSGAQALNIGLNSTLFKNGSASLPSISFIDESTLGWYRTFASSLSLGIGGVEKFRFFNDSLRVPNGSATNPSITALSDDNTGLFFDGGNSIYFTAGGVQQALITTGSIEASPNVQIRARKTTSSTPGYSFAGGDVNTGLGSNVEDELYLSCGSTQALYLTNALGTFINQCRASRYSFNTSNTSYLENTVANTIDIATSSTNRMRVDTALRMQGTTQIMASNGGASIPGYSFTGTSGNLGLYWNGADSFGVTQAGIPRWVFNSSFNFQPGADNSYDIGTSTVYCRNTFSNRFICNNGTASLPSLGIGGMTGLGVYSSATNTLTFATNSVGRVSINTANLITDLPIIAPLGSSSAPGYTFNGDTNTGVFSSGADTLNLACGGTSVFLINTADLIVGSSCLNIQDGTAVNPSLRFFSDSNTGVFRPASDEIAVSLGGTRMYNFNVTAIYPWADNTRSCGANGFRWTAVWAVNGTIQTSDRNQKEEIEDCELGLNFINKLKPKKYKWKPTEYVENVENKETGEYHEEKKVIIPVRKHYGIIAQDVKETLDELKIDTNDFGGYIDTSVKEPDKPQTLGLNYIQFIAPMIKAIQELTSEVNSLKARIEVLESTP